MHRYMEQIDGRHGPCLGEAWINGRYQTRQHGEGLGHPKAVSATNGSGWSWQRKHRVCPGVKWSDWRWGVMRWGVTGRHSHRASPGVGEGLELKSVLRGGTQVHVGTGRWILGGARKHSWQLSRALYSLELMLGVGVDLRQENDAPGRYLLLALALLLSGQGTFITNGLGHRLCQAPGFSLWPFQGLSK